MIFSSRYSIDIPKLDLLSYLFGMELLPASKTDMVWYPVILLGIIGAGGIFTGANPGYTVAELVHQLKVSGASCIFTDQNRLKLTLQAARLIGIPASSVIMINSRDQYKEESEVQQMESLMNHGIYQWERITDGDILSQRTAVLNFSSGTTGPSKACMITHQNLVANAEQTLYLDQLGETKRSDTNFFTHDVHCAFLPIYHATRTVGLVTYCVVNVRRDCTTVIMSKFNLELLLSSIQRFRVTHFLMVPPIAVMLIKTPLLTRYDLSSVKNLLCGGAPLKPDTSAQLESIFSATQARTRQGWGMTEATMAVTLFSPYEFDPSHKSVGHLVPNMEMRVVNSQGHNVGYGKEGEALIRGPNIFKGYYHNEAATRDAWTHDDWLKTGDIIRIQADGMVQIVDRKKGLIKVKGFQVAPSELEGHLLEHQGVLDCAVIRVERNGRECPQAHIVRRDHVSAESILNFMDKRLSAHKRLTGGVVFTDAIPKSPSGKILHRLLRDPGVPNKNPPPRL
ncbi:hypothetical protein BX600DRAFT_482197 [Xylariales sp. PMI_506]|nr:hypothetical protein BX600DRAFT_482197 [Xylariales sp. PMI_506]